MRCDIKDIDFVNGILRHPDIYPFISDDTSPLSKDYTIEPLLKLDKVHIISPDKYTVILFTPRNGTTYEIHYNVLKLGRGENIRNATKDILKYAFNDIHNCKKLICYIADIHKNVVQFAIEIGMIYEGTLTKSIQKNGILHDEIILGMRVDEWEQRRR